MSLIELLVFPVVCHLIFSKVMNMNTFSIDDEEQFIDVRNNKSARRARIKALIEGREIVGQDQETGKLFLLKLDASGNIVKRPVLIKPCTVKNIKAKRRSHMPEPDQNLIE